MATVVSGNTVKLNDGKTVTARRGGWYDGQQFWGGTLSSPGVINSKSDQIGAGQAVSNEVIAQTNPNNVKYIQQRKVQYATNQAQNNAAASYTPPQTPAMTSSVPSLNDVLGGFQSLLPTEQPQTPNLTGTYNQLREQGGLSELEANLADLTAQEDQIAAQLRVNKAAERGKPVAQNVIEGRMSEQERNAQEELAYVGLQKQRLVDQINSAYKNIEIIMNLKKTDYEIAKDQYDTQFDNAMSMINLARNIRQDAITEEQRIIDNARANLQIYVNSITSGNLNYSSLSPEQKTQLTKLELQSGLPAGFISSLSVDPGSQILHINSDTGEVLLSDGNGGFYTKKVMTGTGSTKTTEADAVREMGSFLATRTNSYGHVNGTDYLKARQIWTEQFGGSADEFDKNFRAYIDPYNTEQYQLGNSNSLGLGF